ncbi:MAG: GNAT family N-acetyltransferase [Planctomycetes bacterium]|nr:GNAT family N-acetyltransferase [Planctomycetota bacterium]
MKITPIPASRLTPDLVQAWSDLQRADPRLDSPFLRPELAQLVSQSHDNLEVAVIETGGRAVGFLPFHRMRDRVGLPIVNLISDVQGVVADPSANWIATELLEGCNLAAWQFDHLLAWQAPFQPHHYLLDDSPYIDLSGGFEEYCKARRRAGSQVVSRFQRKAKKLQREVGPIHFEWRDESGEALRLLRQWKREQLQRLRFVDIFASPAMVRLLELIAEARFDRFQGVVSALYAGDRIAAVHLGVQSGGVLSSSIPAHDPDLSRHSPGLILHFELTRAAVNHGVGRIDLGRGENQLKSSLASGAYPVAVGAVELRAAHRVRDAGWRLLRRAVYASPLRDQTLALYRSMRNQLIPHIREAP